MICTYQHKRIPGVRIVFQVRNDRYEKMVALRRRRAEKLGYAAAEFEEVRLSSKGRGT